MANFRKPGTGKKLIAEIISGQSNPNQPWSRAKQEKFVEKLKNSVNVPVFASLKVRCLDI